MPIKFLLSKNFRLIDEDKKRILKNVLLFVGPDLIVFFGALAAKLSAEGAFILVLILNLIIDVLRKWISENNYAVPK